MKLQWLEKGKYFRILLNDVSMLTPKLLNVNAHLQRTRGQFQAVGFDFHEVVCDPLGCESTEH